MPSAEDEKLTSHCELSCSTGAASATAPDNNVPHRRQPAHQRLPMMSSDPQSESYSTLATFNNPPHAREIIPITSVLYQACPTQMNLL